jgi:hypothetical protein
MSIKAYNRGTAALSARLDREAAGVHHDAHRCARVVSKVSP